MNECHRQVTLQLLREEYRERYCFNDERCLRELTAVRTPGNLTSIPRP